MSETKRETYIHGYEEWTRKWMSERTAEREVAFLLPHLRSGQEVLDAGCGPGSITAGLAKIVAPGRVVGLDIEPRQLDAARAFAAEAQIQNLEFQVGSVYDLPFDDASFDAALAHFVIEHISDPLRGLRELRRILRPGGVVAVKDPYYPAFTLRPRLPELERAWELLNRARERAGSSPNHAVDLRALLLEAGFARTTARAGVATTAGEGSGPAPMLMVLPNQLRERSFRDTAIAEGWTTEAELDQLAQTIPTFAARPDIFGFVLWVEALGWVD